MAKKETISPAKKKATSTTFILMFNAFIITAIAIMNSTIEFALIALALFVFQSVLTKNFVETQYSVE